MKTEGMLLPRTENRFPNDHPNYSIHKEEFQIQ